MLHMLRAGSVNQAQQCGRSVVLVRYLGTMKSLKSSFCLAFLAVVGAQAFAQPAAEATRSDATAGAVIRPLAATPHKASGQKDTRADMGAKRGTDLRLALMPQNYNANTNLKTQGGLANVADVSTPESLPEHHLNAKERQEMRELLRQQRLKQQN